MDSSSCSAGKFQDCETIILGDSDDEDLPGDHHTNQDEQAVCLTELEVNILTQRRDQFVMSTLKTLEQYQLLIEEEIASLRTILERHKLMGDSGIDANPYVVNTKKLIAGLCLDLIVDDPVEVSFWNRYEDFCVEFNQGRDGDRREVFEMLLGAEDVPGIVFSHMSYCEHNVSGDYAKAREYLSRGIQKHKECLKLYTTRMELEIGECYSSRDIFDPKKSYNSEEEAILNGDHLFETYEALKENLKEINTSVVKELDAFLKFTCDKYPCAPVHKLKEKILFDMKRAFPECPEVVDLEARLYLDAGTSDSTARLKLLAAFRTYWNNFLSSQYNPEIIHRAIATFSELDLKLTSVRRILYLILDIGLYYKCLEPSHVSLYFTQLALEKHDLANMKMRFTFRYLASDPKLNGTEGIWHVKFNTFFHLYGPDHQRLEKLMVMAHNSLGHPKSLLAVSARVFSQMCTKSDKDSVQYIKLMFKWLNAASSESPRVQEEVKRMLIMWLLSRGRIKTAKTQFVKLKASEVDRERESLHSELLGQLLMYNPVKQEPNE